MRPPAWCESATLRRGRFSVGNESICPSNAELGKYAIGIDHPEFHRYSESFAVSGLLMLSTRLFA